MSEHNLDQKKEIVYRSYSVTLDIELAYKKADVSEAEIEKIEADEEFQYRLAISEAELKEGLISKLKSIADDDKVNHKTKLQAIVELGNILYDDKFSKVKRRSDEDDGQAVLQLFLPDNGRKRKS